MTKEFNKLWKMFTIFFKIGCFTFGGGYAMIPLIEKEVVDKQGWIKSEEIIDIFAVAQSIPGAIAINSSTLIGYKIKGKKGALAATLGVILPSLFIILIIGTFFTRFQSNPYVQSAFKGIRPAVVALILLAAVKIGRKSIKDWACVGIAVIAFVLVFVFKVHAIYTILGGAVAGLLLYKFFPNLVIKQDDKGGQQ